ncbi:MAG: glycosyltransferase N-terminal domain-containing protein [bacterium]
MSRARTRDRVGHWLAGTLGPLIIGALARTLRVSFAGGASLDRARATGTPVLFAVWHGRVIPFVATHRARGIVGLVSEHRDGEYIARVLGPLGFGVVRGSTTRGAARALFDMAQRAREGRDLALTPDGPRGPRRAVRPGVVALARRAGTPIVPVGVASGGFVFPTWDRFVFPWPFSRVAVVYADPFLPSGSDVESADGSHEEIAMRIERATEEADRMIAPGGPGRLLFAVYRAATGVLHALIAPVAHAMAKLGRRGAASRVGSIPNLPRGAIWVHAASVGEILGVRPILDGLRRAAPDTPIAISTMTHTGLAVARGFDSPGVEAFLLPFDFPRAVRSVFDALEPRALIVAETELWPNLLHEARTRGVPVALVNGRISPRSFARYRAGRAFFRRVLEGVSWIGAQTEGDRLRFVAIGAREDRVEVVGSTKSDVRGSASDATRESGRRSIGLEDDVPVVIFGSARGAEAEVFNEAVRALLAGYARLRVIYAPRHLGRVADIVRDLSAARVAGDALPVLTLTQWRGEPRAYRCLVVDTIGELSDLYAVADVAVVGGSFSSHGGHNPLEPAVRGVPVLMGPHRQHVEEAFSRLAAIGGAEEARDAGDLVSRIARLIDDPAEREQRARALREHAASAGTLVETVIERLIGRGILSASGRARAMPMARARDA